MKIEKRPYGIYRFHQYTGKPGFWKRTSVYGDIEDAKRALKDLTRRSKKHRIYVYIILPVQSRERWIFLKEHEQLIKVAR